MIIRYGITYLDYTTGLRESYLNNSTFERKGLALREIDLLKKGQEKLKRNHLPRTRGYFKVKEHKIKKLLNIEIS